MQDLVFRDLQTLLRANYPYVENYKNHLSLIEMNLWRNLDKVPNLSKEKIDKVMKRFLSLACEGQNVINIELGRASLLALPQIWLLENIRSYVDRLMNKESEFRKLLEICWKLDENLALELAEKGAANPNPEIREAANEALTQLNKIKRDI